MVMVDFEEQSRVVLGGMSGFALADVFEVLRAFNFL